MTTRVATVCASDRPGGRRAAFGWSFNGSRPRVRLPPARRTADLAPEVHAVRGEEHQSEDWLEANATSPKATLTTKIGRNQPLVLGQAPRSRVGQVARARVARVDGTSEARPPTPQGLCASAAALEKEHRSGHPVGDGGQGQRAAHGGADADVLGLGVRPGGDRDQGDHRLRQCGPERGQDGADGHLPDAEALAEPLHGVDEPFARQVDRHGAGQQQDDMDHEGRRLPRPHPDAERSN